MALNLPFAFVSAGLDVGLGFDTALYEARPDELVNDLQSKLKVAAKLVSKAGGIPRTKSYDALARAGGFSHWHQLSTHLAGAQAPATPEWLESFIPLLPLIAVLPTESAPSRERRQVLEAFWLHVGDEAGVPHDTILDDVGARMHGERSWNGLLSRTPLDATGWLYRFSTEPADGNGAFVWSETCAALVDELDDQWQGYEKFSPEAKSRARSWVEQALVRQPDFLEGGLALAWMQKSEESSKAAATLNTYLRKAEALIPQGFKGTMSWYVTENRFYLRMLHLRMALYRDEFDMKRSATIAKKLLRLNPNDNLGVRDCLPLLLLSLDDYQGALRACKRLEEEPHFQSAAIRAFVFYANGNLTEFRTQLLTALFTWPILRAFLEDSDDTLAEDESGSRSVIPDFEIFQDFAWPALNTVPGLREAALAVVRDKRVVAAEAQLLTIWQGFRRTREGKPATHTGEEWDAGWRRHVAELA